MHIGKYKYEDWQPKRTIRTGIEDFEPYIIQFDTPPPPEQFINFGLAPKDQFFVQEEIPEWVHKLNKRPREEAFRTVSQNKYMGEWIDSQWRKRSEGVHIYINGKPYYIPGKYWWYLNYYFQNIAIGVGLADFRMPDLEYFWIWCLIIMQDPDCYGLIEWSSRRQGKSARAMAEDLEEISKTANVKAGIQSKTDKDARDTFQEFIVEPWRRLPFFFSPLFDNKTYPAKELNFRSASESGQSLDASLLAESVSKELGSSIEVRATVFNAFDGRKLRRYTLDEAAKCDEMDTYKAWKKHKECLALQDTIIGKAKITSTTELMTKYGMEPYLRIWDESNRNPEELTELLQTDSGLYPLFTPGFAAWIFDAYGTPIIDDPTKEQEEFQKQRLIKKKQFKKVELGWHLKGGRELFEMKLASFNSDEARQDYIRMFPPSIAEARRTDGKECHFPAHVHLIDKRLYELKHGNKDEEEFQCNLAWKEGVRFSEVILKMCQHKDEQGRPYKGRCPTCRWRFYYFPTAYFNNVIKDERGFYRPGNKGRGLASADTFKYNDTEGNKRSKAASHVFWELDLEIDAGREPEQRVTDDFIMEYVYRHPSKTLFGEDMIMQCWLLGIEMFPEINVPFIWDYFVENRMEKFLKFRKLMKRGENGKFSIEESKTPGLTTLGDSIKDPMFAAVENYLDKSVLRCKAIKFLQDCRTVEYKKLSPYDAFVSGSQCLYGRSMLKPVRSEKQSVKSRNLDDILGFRVAGT